MSVVSRELTTHAAQSEVLVQAVSHGSFCHESISKAQSNIIVGHSACSSSTHLVPDTRVVELCDPGIGQGEEQENDRACRLAAHSE